MVYIFFFRLPLSLVANSTGDQASGSGSPTPPQHAPKGLGNKMYNVCTTKVVRAEKRVGAGGKVEFMAHEAAYVELKPSTANATYIQHPKYLGN